MALSLSPVSLPALTASVAALAPGRLDAEGPRAHMPLHRRFLVLAAFVMDVDGLFAAAGYAVVGLTVVLTRASVMLHLLAGAYYLVLVGTVRSRPSCPARPAASCPRCAY